MGLVRAKQPDLKYVELCARNIARVAKEDKIVVKNLHYPLELRKLYKTILDSTGNGINFEVLSNPEFLAEGTAIQDLFKSDRVLIGGNQTKKGKEAINKLVDVYANWIPKKKFILQTYGHLNYQNL